MGESITILTLHNKLFAHATRKTKVFIDRTTVVHSYQSTQSTHTKK